MDVGRLKEGDKLLQRMAAAGLPADVRAYNILLAGHGRAGNPAAMDKLLGRMTSAGVRPSSVTFNTLVDGYARARNLAAAEGVLARATAAAEGVGRPPRAAAAVAVAATAIEGCRQPSTNPFLLPLMPA